MSEKIQSDFTADYVCGYCKHPFTRTVKYFNGVRDNVKCPSCKNFLKTVDDALNMRDVEKQKDEVKK